MTACEACQKPEPVVPQGLPCSANIEVELLCACHAQAGDRWVGIMHAVPYPGSFRTGVFGSRGRLPGPPGCCVLLKARLLLLPPH
jgi:hypothetical protein